eukprot:maker-scaffold_9-snap-gene-8.59-mRNA-1 protein AED:0.26 eAED:0.27 QI:0/0/0/1/0/0/2/0/407
MELDRYLEDDSGSEWDDDVEEVRNIDKYNKTDFSQQATEVYEEHVPELVQGSSKPDVIRVSNFQAARSSVPPPAAAEVEEEELKQARSDPKVSNPSPYTSREHKTSSPTVSNRVKTPPKAPKKKVSRERLPSFQQPKDRNIRKVSVNNAGKLIDSAFTNGKYSQEVIEFFSEMNQKSITEQAIAYLNAYWDEVGDQAEFIFSVAIRIFREADMHRQGISLYYKYDEGSSVDYPTYLYFYEKLVQFVDKNPQWRSDQYQKSAVYEVKTAIKHKNELKEKVDVNFDGQVSFLEFLIYQYNVYSNPAGFMQRAQVTGEEHPTVRAARLALEQHQLTMLDVSPLSEELNKALITAEAAVRLAVRRFGGSTVLGIGGGGANATPRGALWWMQRDLQEKKKVAVPKTLRRVKK